MFVSNELISETAPPIFLKLGMKLGDNRDKKSHFAQFWPNVPKNGHFGPKSQFVNMFVNMFN